MAEVRTTFTSDDKEVQKSLAALQKQMQGLIEQNRKLREESKNAGDAMTGGLSDASEQLIRLASGYMGVSAAMGVVTTALDNIEKKHQKVMQAQMTAAAAERSYLLNYGSPSAGGVEQARQQALGIAQRTGTTVEDVYRVAAAGVSSTTSKDQMAAAVEMALRIQPGNQQEAIALAGAIGDASNLTGSQDAGVNMGFIQYALGQSRVSTMQGIGTQVLRGAAAVKSYGGEANEALAFVNMLTKKTNDITGEKSATLATATAAQLEAFLPTEDRYTYDSKGRKTLSRKGTGLTSTNQRATFLQQNPKLADEFLSGASLPQGGNVIREFLTAGSEADRIYRESSGNRLTYDELRKLNEQNIAAIESSPLQKTSAINRQLESANTRVEERDFDTASKGAIAANMDRLRSQADMAGINRMGYKVQDLVEATFSTKEQFAASKASELEERLVRNQLPPERADSVREMIAVLRSIEKNTGKKLNIDGNAEGGN